MPARLFTALLLLALTPGVLPANRTEAARPVITYTVEPRPQDSCYQITMDVPKVTDATLRLELPVWTPGVYSRDNNAENIVDVTAEDKSRKTLRTFHPAPNRWEVSADGAEFVRVRYRVKSTGQVRIDSVPKRGHINGPRTYLYVVGRKAEPVQLAILPPTGAKIWKVATSLDPLDATKTDAGSEPIGPPVTRRFTAASYDELADAPVEMGDYAEERFVVRGKPHHIILYGSYESLDRARLRNDCQRVAESLTAFFGDAPYPRYIFMFRVAEGGGGGGLEHLNAMEIRLPRTGEQPVTVGIVGIMHEFFHLWNVKRIRPFVLGPFEYQDPPRTANLWWCEGVTDYYAYLLSRRGGMITDADYLRHLTETITRLQNTPARLQVSADESSLRVWEVDNNEGYGLSYYLKGCLVGLCLDLKIRQVSKGRHSLDDVLRALYLQCGRGRGPGFGEDDIKTTINRVVGKDLSAFYDQVARSTEELPLAECLAYAGMSLRQSEETLADPGMSLLPDREFQALLVQTCPPEGAAGKAGLRTGDRIVAIDGQTGQIAAMRLFRSLPSASFTLTVERDGNRREVNYVVGSKHRTVWQVSPNADATPAQMDFRRQWLGGSLNENGKEAFETDRR